MTAESDMANEILKRKEADAIRALCNDNLDELVLIYNMMNPDFPPLDMGSMPVFAELDRPNIKGDECAAVLNEAAQTGAGSGDPRHFSLVISSAYAFEAMHSINYGNLINAWRCLTEARYYCGSYSVNPGLRGARQNTLDEGRRHIPSSGGRARATRLYGESRKKVEELARSLCPEGGWRDRTEAVKAIGEILDKGVKSLEQEPQPTDRTINDWLAAMPAGDQLFKRKRKR